MENAVAEWMAQYVGPNMEGLMLFVAVGFFFPLCGMIIYLASLDFSLVILGIAVLSLISGCAGVVLALANFSLAPIWLPDFIQLIGIGIAALIVYKIWGHLVRD